MVIDFRRANTQHHALLTIGDTAVEKISTIQFLRGNLTSTTNTLAIVKKAQQRLHSFRRLKKTSLPYPHPTIFYRSTTESIA